MTLWESMEDFIFEWQIAGYDQFDSKTLDGWDGLPAGRNGSDLIQAYQDAMLHDMANPKTQFAIWRKPGTRTTTAKWHIKEWREFTLHDKRMLLESFADDQMNRISNFLSPIIDLAASLSPKARKHHTKTLMQIGMLIKSLTELR